MSLSRRVLTEIHGSEKLQLFADGTSDEVKIALANISAGGDGSGKK